jgi:hypothetical protein
VQSAEIVAKRIEGGVQKYLKEVSLLNQSFVKNDKQTVEQMLKTANTTVKAFTLYVVGEGIEKKVDDFAAEVAAQVAAAQKASLKGCPAPQRAHLNCQIISGEPHVRRQTSVPAHFAQAVG